MIQEKNGVSFQSEHRNPKCKTFSLSFKSIKERIVKSEFRMNGRDEEKNTNRDKFNIIQNSRLEEKEKKKLE